VSAPVIATSLFARFASRDKDAYSNRLVAALRNQFGGHAVVTEAARSAPGGKSKSGAKSSSGAKSKAGGKSGGGGKSKSGGKSAAAGKSAS
jgi:hypothetical protein